VGIPEENGMTLSDQTGPTKRAGSYHFYSFSEFPTKVKRRRTMKWFIKMEQQISVGPVQLVKVDYLQM